jgi:beta-glucosidase
LYGDYSYGSKLTHRGTERLVADDGPVASISYVLTPRAALAERFTLTDDVAAADVAVVFVGGRSGMSAQDTSGEFRDACDLRLFPEQIELIEQTAASGVPTVVVLIGGRAHSLSEVVPLANALVMAWLPGDEGARGIVDVLSGDVDAGGRLPVSLLRTVGQVGAYPGHHHGGGRSLLYGDYIDGGVSPLFPFGHGLSYTTWRYDRLEVHAGSTADDIRVTVVLTNSGGRDGEEVVQVYARDEVASVGRPARLLVAFRRVALAAGTSARIVFTLAAGKLGFHGRDLRFRVEPGQVTFLVGGLEHTVEITGDVAHPDPNTLPAVTSSVEPILTHDADVMREDVATRPEI